MIVGQVEITCSISPTTQKTTLWLERKNPKTGWWSTVDSYQYAELIPTARGTIFQLRFTCDESGLYRFGYYIVATLDGTWTRSIKGEPETVNC